MPPRTILPKPARAAGRLQRGVAAVELALVLPVLLLLSMGVAELGRLVYTYNTMLKAVHGAARYLAMSDQVAISATDRATVRSEALNLALYGDLQAQSSPLVPGLDASMVRVCTVDVCPDHVKPTLNYVSVGISGYSYAPMLSVLLIKPLALRDITSTLRGRL